MGNQDAGGNDKQSCKREDKWREDNDRSTKNSLEVWCICRIVKPCTCGKRQEKERDITPTPNDDETDPEGESSGRATPTPEESSEDKPGDRKCKNCVNSKEINEKSGNSSCNKANELNESDTVHLSDVEKCDKVKSITGSNSYEDKVKQEVIQDFDDCVSKLQALAKSDFELHVLDIETGKISKDKTDKETVSEKENVVATERESLREHKHTKERKLSDKGLDTDSEAEMDPAKLDSVSLSSFDHIDFDASFSSWKSTGSFSYTYNRYRDTLNWHMRDLAVTFQGLIVQK